MNATQRIEADIAANRLAAESKRERGEGDAMEQEQISRLSGELSRLRKINEELRPQAEAASRRETERAQGHGKLDLDDLRRREGQEELEQFRTTQRNLWITHGGTGEEFEAHWPRIKAEYIREKSHEAYKDARSPFTRW